MLRLLSFNAIASIGEDYIFEELCHGCGGCILVGPEGYVREKMLKSVK